ncbi:MAG: hypothetical protein AAFQ94_24640 [Bacteroidota bacterium]
MQELFDHSFSMINIVPTFLLFFSLLYWVIVMLGAIDLDFFDVDVDLDIDADIDVDVDMDAPDNVSIGWLNSVLVFFNLGQIPLMIFITFLALPMWFIGVVGNYYLGITNIGLSLLLLIPNFIVSLFIAKFATMPFVKLFTKLKKEETSMTSLTGSVCKVILVATDEHVGQAEVKQDGSSFLINTKSPNGQKINKGETALIIDYNEENKIFLIEPYQI